MKALLNFCYILYGLIKDLSGFLRWLLRLADCFPFNSLVRQPLFVFICACNPAKTLYVFAQNIQCFYQKCAGFSGERLGGFLYGVSALILYKKWLFCLCEKRCFVNIKCRCYVIGKIWELDGMQSRVILFILFPKGKNM